MNCIIVDDEPLAREGLELLILRQAPQLKILGTFGGAAAASKFMSENQVDLLFLDIQMPEITGLEFARTIGDSTLIIFTTAYTEYALDSYEVDAIDYLLKPISSARFQKAVEKAISYHDMLLTEIKNIEVEKTEYDYLFVRSDRKNIKIFFHDILFIEGLKDYVIIHTKDKKVITLISIKSILEQLPQSTFVRVSRSYIVNSLHIDSFNNNDIFIGTHEIAIGNSYRDHFFEEFVSKRMLNQ